MRSDRVLVRLLHVCAECGVHADGGALKGGGGARRMAAAARVRGAAGRAPERRLDTRIGLTRPLAADGAGGGGG